MDTLANLDFGSHELWIGILIGLTVGGLIHRMEIARREARAAKSEASKVN